MMAASLAVPAESMRLPDRGPGQEIITEMAWLLRDTRGSMLLDGSVLSAVTSGIAVEAPKGLLYLDVCQLSPDGSS